MTKKRRPFDRYDYYRRAVQTPDIECRFLAQTYKELRGRRPRILREDFCGTFAICCEWTKLNRENRAIGIDLDNEPIAYGSARYLPALKAHQAERIQIHQASVLNARVEKADVTAALNFSYYIFKTRDDLRTYFMRARKGLKSKGVFIADCFGGKDCQEANVEVTKIEDFHYYWDQMSFDPVTHAALFHIHFKRRGEKIRRRVFTYDWRMWTIPEIREILVEAGFKRTHVYWELTDRKGEGTGVFKRSEKGEECDGWVAYVVGEV